MAPWIALVLGLSSPAAGGISIGSEAIAFEADTAPPVCWVGPRKLRKKDRARLQRAFERAGQATMPGHVRYRIEGIRSAKSTQVDCKAFVTVHLRGPRKRTRVTVSVRPPDKKTATRVARFHVARWKVDRTHFESAWGAIWDHIGPPPPPPPPTDPIPPPPTAASPFVDNELAQEQARANAPAVVAPPPPWSPPWVSAALEGGWSARSLNDAPGATQSSAQVATLGARLTVHGARGLDLGPQHDLDIDLGYWRRFVDGRQGGRPVSVSADRVGITGRYRYAWSASIPRLGPLLGYEFTRFESSADAALSTRFSVLRLGVDGAQPIWRLAPGTGLWLLAHTALRWSPTGDAGLGFDVQGEASFRTRLGLFISLGARLIRQSGETSGATFTDQTVDAFATVGWSL